MARSLLPIEGVTDAGLGFHCQQAVEKSHRGQPFYEAKFRHQGRQVKRRIGSAWHE